MGAAPSEYDAVIADLENQVIELQGTIEILKRQRDKTSGTTTATAPVDAAPTARKSRFGDIFPAGAVSIASDAFFGMSIVDAAKKYLNMVKKPQDTKAIMEALERGGFQHTSKNFYGTIFSVIRRRAKNEGDIVKVSSGLWGLTDWYPALKRKGGIAKREEEVTEAEAFERMRPRPEEGPPA
jgi:hypothetical protein